METSGTSLVLVATSVLGSSSFTLQYVCSGTVDSAGLLRWFSFLNFWFSASFNQKPLYCFLVFSSCSVFFFFLAVLGIFFVGWFTFSNFAGGAGFGLAFSGCLFSTSNFGFLIVGVLAGFLFVGFLSADILD